MSGDIPVLDLDDLDPGARAWLERLVASGSMLLHRGGDSLGAVSFTPSVLEGTVVGGAVSSNRTRTDMLPDGVKVLATTMKLRPEARERLREFFGPDWVVLDFHDAPDTADVVLTAAHSPQLIHRWTLLFPQAQIVVTEILDNEFGLEVGGPVGRLMDAGAHAYLPPPTSGTGCPERPELPGEPSPCGARLCRARHPSDRLLTAARRRTTIGSCARTAADIRTFTGEGDVS